jgi:hypothetical protein
MTNNNTTTLTSRRTALKTLSVFGFTGGIGRASTDLAKADSESAVHYDDLPPHAQQKIDEVVTNGEVAGLHSALPKELIQSDAVIIDGERIPLAIKSKRIDPYRISPSKASQTEIPKSDLVKIDDLGWGKHLFEKALANGSVETGMEMPDPFLNNQYAEYNDTVYELNQIALGPPMAMISLRR